MHHLVNVDHNSMAAHLTRSVCERFKKCCISNEEDGNVWSECEKDGNSLIGKGRESDMPAVLSA